MSFEDIDLNRIHNLFAELGRQLDELRGHL